MRRTAAQRRRTTALRAEAAERIEVHARQRYVIVENAFSVLDSLYSLVYAYTASPHDGLRELRIYLFIYLSTYIAFSALTLLVGRQEGHLACKELEW